MLGDGVSTGNAVTGSRAKRAIYQKNQGRKNERRRSEPVTTFPVLIDFALKPRLFSPQIKNCENAAQIHRKTCRRISGVTAVRADVCFQHFRQ